MVASAYEEVTYQVADGVATISLNRPDRLNAWTKTMNDEVAAAMRRADEDPEAVVIVLTGAGRAFCAGVDLGILKRQGERVAAAPAKQESERKSKPKRRKIDFLYLMRLRKPVIAAINGACAGMAIPLSLCCDLRFASQDAVFTTAFVRRGLIAEMGSASLLARQIGNAHALEILLSGRKFDGAEAERIGLVNKALPADELMPYVDAYARDMAEKCAPRSLQVMKEQVYDAARESLEDSYDKSLDLMYDSVEFPDFKEGVAAMVERRAPSFPRIGAA